GELADRQSGGGVDIERLNPYLWLHLWQHCATAGPQSLDTLRAFVARNDVWRHDLALGLTYLGIRYSQLGRRQDALAPSEEAVTLYRELAAQNPTFLPNLAGSLNNLGICY